MLKTPRAQLTEDQKIAIMEAKLAKARARCEGESDDSSSSSESDGDDSDVEREVELELEEDEEEEEADFHGPPTKKQRQLEASADMSDDEKPRPATKKAHQPIKRQIVKLDDSKTAAAASAASAAAKKLPVSCKRDASLASKEVTVGERFNRGENGPRFEVISIPEVSLPSMRCPPKRTEPGGKTVTKLMPDWTKASHKRHAINARDTSKDPKDQSGYETFLQLSHDTLYSVSLTGAGHMIKNDCNNVTQALKDYRQDAKTHRNIIPTACDISPRGEITWMPWNLYYQMLETTSTPAAAAAAAAASSSSSAPNKRKSPGASATAAAAHASPEVPDLMLETAKQWVAKDLAPRCKEFGADNPMVYLDMLQTNYAKLWKSAPAADPDAAPATPAAPMEAAMAKMYARNCVAKDPATGKPLQTAAAFAIGLQMRMFTMMHPAGKQLIADLRAKFADDAMQAIKLARRGAGDNQDDEDLEC